MVYIGIGAGSFILGYLHDLAEVHKHIFVKNVLGMTSFVLFAFSTAMLCIKSPLFVLPDFPSKAAWLFFGVFALLFFYSASLELILRQKVGDGKGRRLVTTGTYALTRHPSAIWSILAIGFLILATRSVYLLWAWPVWTVMELVWVWLQDRFFLPSMYPGYSQYRQKTPMLVPTQESLKEFLTVVWQLPGKH
ncbi:MAG: hypothetical protein HY663_00615 [Chloroflexi bacterium]|nr:hypothetical protein [Chloroflexota bacterium]